MTTDRPARGTDAAGPATLGLQVRDARNRAGLTLRELAGQLGVSPSLLSQIENGKSQPSVATLYALAQALKISIDNLFAVQDGNALADVGTAESGEAARDNVVPLDGHAAGRSSVGSGDHARSLKRADLGSLHQVWQGGGSADRLSVTTPSSRNRLVMDTGVIWEQLASNTGHQLDFMEITYPPGSCSTSDERMLQHEGFEYGYVLEGELEITLGFEVFILRVGEAVGLNSSIPHLLRNRGTIPARGIWFVHHRHD